MEALANFHFERKAAVIVCVADGSVGLERYILAATDLTRCCMFADTERVPRQDIPGKRLRYESHYGCN